MLESGFTSVLKVRNRYELQDQVVAFTKRLGFETVSATVVIDHLLGEAEFITIDNTPRAYRESFKTARIGGAIRCMQHCKRQSMPIIWDQSTYAEQGLGEMWEAAGAVRLPLRHRHGAAHARWASFLPRRRPRQARSARIRREVTRIVADLQLFAVHAQDAAMRILTPALSSAERTVVDAARARRRCAGRWKARRLGRSANVLGISERTAALHVNNATHKLDCVNKHQAVLKALRLGLIR